jgi:hypothetical protein
VAIDSEEDSRATIDSLYSAGTINNNAPNEPSVEREEISFAGGTSSEETEDTNNNQPNEATAMVFLQESKLSALEVKATAARDLREQQRPVALLTRRSNTNSSASGSPHTINPRVLPEEEGSLLLACLRERRNNRQVLRQPIAEEESSEDEGSEEASSARINESSSVKSQTTLSASSELRVSMGNASTEGTSADNSSIGSGNGDVDAPDEWIAEEVNRKSVDWEDLAENYAADGIVDAAPMFHGEAHYRNN